VDKDMLLIFLALVFGAVFMLTQSIAVPIFGTGRQESRKLKQRLSNLTDEYQPIQPSSLVREKYLKHLSPIEIWMESLPGMMRLEIFIERSGHALPAYRLILLSVFLGLLGSGLAWTLNYHGSIIIAVAVILTALPTLKLKRDLSKRLAKFEEQLPEALDVMTRALRAGYPFNETLHLVATDMENPIAGEFRMVFEEVNFGVDMRWALRNLVERIPSTSLMAIVTSILVQRETGGNLAETFESIGKLIRERFKFQRRVLTLTAESRMAALILSMIPFAFFAMMSLTNPDYLADLINDPLGKKMLAYGISLFIIGNIWMRKQIAMDI
jgi:tight adherence protein B